MYRQRWCPSPTAGSEKFRVITNILRSHQQRTESECESGKYDTCVCRKPLADSNAGRTWLPYHCCWYKTTACIPTTRNKKHPDERYSRWGLVCESCFSAVLQYNTCPALWPLGTRNETQEWKLPTCDHVRLETPPTNYTKHYQKKNKISWSNCCWATSR